jgi:hypothetical protein
VIRVAGLIVLILAGAVLAGCGRVGSTRTARGAPAASVAASWIGRQHVRGVVDLSAPRRDGALVVAAAGRLLLLGPGGKLRPFAPGYAAPPGLEPYIALSPGHQVTGAGCRFGAGSIYALRLRHGDGVTVVDSRGAARRFATLPSAGLENGIAFDGAGRFGYRLLVTRLVARRMTTVFAIDCRGHVSTLTGDAPRVEGGIAVAPATFGRFAGDLIAPDELSGNLYAIAPDGHASLVAASGLPHGQDIGVESEGFVPRRFGEALVADRGTPGNPHPGDNLVLGVPRAALAAAGVRAGDLLVVTEGGAATIAVRCGARSCQVRDVARGPAQAHIEGHVVFAGA